MHWRDKRDEVERRMRETDYNMVMLTIILTSLAIVGFGVLM